LVKKYLNSDNGVIRTFGTLGIGERFTSGDSQFQTLDRYTLPPPFSSTTIFTASETVRSKKSTGALLGYGVQMKIKNKFFVSPQVRFARWSNQPFSQAKVLSNRNSLDVLLSLRIAVRH
jgi:hypothetical protein